MPNTYEHEEYRWGYMTSQQLLRRLSKIKDPTKLRYFAACAYNRGNDELLVEASRRAADLGMRLGEPFDHNVYQLVTGNRQNRRESSILKRLPDHGPMKTVKTRQKQQRPRVRVLKGLE